MLSEGDILEIIVKHAPKSGSILEVGCKSGGMVIALAERVGNFIHGVDRSKSAISEAQRKSLSFPNTFFDVMKAEELNFPDDIFHLVYSVRTLHETRAKKSLGEMHRVLAPRGVLVVIDWTKEAAASWSEKSFGLKELRKMLSRVAFEHFKIDVRNDFYVLIARK